MHQAPITWVPAPPPASFGPNTVCLLGDSYSYFNQYASGSHILADVRGFLTWFNMFSGHKLRLLNNGGVIGETTAQMLARVASDVLVHGPGYCVVMGGTNDIYNSGLSASAIIGNLTSMCDSLRAAGIIVILGTLPAVHSTWGQWSAAKQQEHFDLNQRIRDYAYGRNGVMLVDFYKATVEPTSATGIVKTGYTYDYVHPSNIGAFWMGWEMYNNSALNALLPNPVKLISSYADNYATNSASKQHLQYGLFQGSGGTPGTGVSGTVATGWTISRSAGTPTAVASTPARADGIGNDQSLGCTFGASGDSFIIRSADSKGGISAGDVIWGEAAIALSVAGVVDRLYMTVTVVQGSTYYSYAFSPNASGDSAYSTAWSGTLVTPRITVGGGAVTNIYLDVIVRGNAAGSGTITIGRAAIRRK